MPVQTFVGRKYELENLKEWHTKRTPNFIVVQGRRRIGKSRLIRVFASQYPQVKFWKFYGPTPEAGIDAQIQRDEFVAQLADQLTNPLNSPPFTPQSWRVAFKDLSQHVKAHDIILFDEISWMGSKDPRFISHLKEWWEGQTLPIMLVLCGANSTWIEKNILNNTAFYGRVTRRIVLKPLSIPEANTALKHAGFRGSPYDTYRVLSILGGVPWYLEQMLPAQTTDAFIQKVCFEPASPLATEFDQIFHDLFDHKGSTYQKILYCLKDGMKTLDEIGKRIAFAGNGTLNSLMEHLITAGFVEKHGLWLFKTHQPIKQHLYRISDPYIRFYLKFIAPLRVEIDNGNFAGMDPSPRLKGFETHLALQLEQLLAQNRRILLKALGVASTTVARAGPYRQFKTAQRPGCQIDYLVETNTQNLYLCEFKFRRNTVGIELIPEVQRKMDVLDVPEGFEKIPILFHIGGVSDKLVQCDFFHKIINIADFLKEDF